MVVLVACPLWWRCGNKRPTDQLASRRRALGQASRTSRGLLLPHAGTDPIPLVGTMPQKVTETPYPLIDADPHASRVVRYFRPSDYAVWATGTAAFPSALYLWGMSMPITS